MTKILTYALSAVVLVGFSGCSIKDQNRNDDLVLQKLNNLEYQLAQKDERIKALQKAQIITQRRYTEQSSVASSGSSTSYGNDLVPPNAKPGECYAKVLLPARYKKVQERVLVMPEREDIKLIPATYKWVNKRVVIEEAGYKIVNVPAQYKWVKARVEVEPEREKLVSSPPRYKNVTEKILVRAAYTTWKKGRGEFEKLNNKTGDIMCLVEVPAQYKSITKRVLVKPAKTSIVKLPAKYSIIRKKVLVKEAETKRIPTEPVYKTIRVKQLVTPASERRVPVAAQYKTIEKKIIVNPSSINWKKILCETNVTKNVVVNLQRKLKSLSFYHGRVNGKFGSSTRSALKSYQQSRGYAEGALTIESLRSLNIL